MSNDLMADRYGTNRTGAKRFAVVVSVLVALVFAGTLTWIIMQNSSPETSIKVVTFDVVDEHQVTTDVTVHLSDDVVEALADGSGTTVTCTVAAGSVDGARVGETTFTPLQGRQSIEIRTDREATTVMEQGCHVSE